MCQSCNNQRAEQSERPKSLCFQQCHDDKGNTRHFFFSFFFLSKAQPASHSGAKSFHCESAHVRPGGGRARATFTHKPLLKLKRSSCAARVPLASHRRRAKCIHSWHGLINVMFPESYRPMPRLAGAACASLCGKLQTGTRGNPQDNGPAPVASVTHSAPAKHINNTLSLCKQYTFNGIQIQMLLITVSKKALYLILFLLEVDYFTYNVKTDICPTIIF